MASKQDVLMSLGKSKKGMLKYDKEWFEKGDIEEILATCSSPPTISAISSPHHSPSVKTNEDSGSAVMRDLGIRTNRNTGSRCSPQGSYKPTPVSNKLSCSLRPISQSTPTTQESNEVCDSSDKISLSPISFTLHSPDDNVFKLKRNYSDRRKMKLDAVIDGNRQHGENIVVQTQMTRTQEGQVNSADLQSKVEGKNQKDSRPETPTGKWSDYIDSVDLQTLGISENCDDGNVDINNVINLTEKRLEIAHDANVVEIAIKELEEERHKKVKEIVETKKRVASKFSLLLQQQAASQNAALERNVSTKTQKHLQQAQQACTQNEELKQRQQKLKERHQEHAKELDVKMREAQARKLALLEQEKKQKMELMRQRLDTMKSLLEDLKSTCQLAYQQLDSCKNVDLLPEKAKRARLLMQSILNHGEKILKEAEIEVTTSHVQKINELCNNARNALDYITTIVEDTNKKADEEAAKAAEAAKVAAAAAAAAAATQISATGPVNQTQKSQHSTAAGVPSTTGDEILCVFPESYKEYTRLQGLAEQVAKTCEDITNNSQFKKVKFDLSKAVNIPINAIAPTSGSHLRDKLQRLLKLLAGQPVDVGSRIPVSTSSHPAGLSFCKDLLAKKIVKQGDEQVSCNHESAFAIAAVTLGIWCHNADFGGLLLAHFYKACPYLVPYYIPKQDGQTSEEYHKALGYNYTDGVVEKQDKFLKRMSGIMRLYASIIVSTPIENRPHPHGIQHAWAWLARVMNIDPYPDITATMIHDLLQVAGNMLVRTYSKQFYKLLMTLITDFLPKIKAVSPSGSGGPYTRLQIFLEKTVREKRIAPPAGILPTNFL